MSKIGIIVASSNNNQKLAIELQKIAIELNYDSEIINFAKDQGFKTIAEFVSSKEILEKVKYLGVDYVQGYYIHEPSDKIEN